MSHKRKSKALPKSASTPDAKDSTGRILGIRYWIWSALILVVGLGSVLLWNRNQKYQKVTELRQQFQSLRERGDWAKCEQAAVDWGVLDPTSSEPILLAALAAENQQAVDRAIAYLMQLPSDAPVDALVYLSRLQFEKLDDPVQSLETSLRIAKRSPSNQAAHLQLLYFWAMTRQTSKLIEEAKRGIRDGAYSLETFTYLFEGDRVRFSDELVTNRRWAEAWPEEESFHVAAVLAMVREAERLESKSGESEFDPIEMRKKLDEDLDLLGQSFPSNLDVIAFRIQRAMNNGDAETVRHMLKDSPKAFEQDHRFWRVKGWLLDYEQKPAEALLEYNRSVALNPFDMQNYFERAGIYRQLGKLDQVEADTKLGILSKDLHATFRDTDTIFSLENSYYERLIDFFEQSLQNQYVPLLRSKLKERKSDPATHPQKTGREK